MIITFVLPVCIFVTEHACRIKFLVFYYYFYFFLGDKDKSFKTIFATLCLIAVATSPLVYRGWHTLNIKSKSSGK